VSYIKLFVLVTIVLSSITGLLSAQSVPDSLRTDSTQTQSIQPPEDDRWHTTLERVNFRNTRLNDILQGVAVQNGLNVVVDETVTARISVHFTDVAIWDMVTYLANQYDLHLEWNGNILMVSPKQMRQVPEQPTGQFTITVEDSVFSVAVSEFPIRKAASRMSEETGVNILVDPGIQKKVSGELRDIAIEEGIQVFFRHNGYRVRKQGNVYFIGLPPGDGRQGRQFDQWVAVKDDSVVSLDLVNADIQQVIQQIAEKSNLSIINYNQIPGTITAKTQNLPLPQTLDLLLKNTDFTYRVDRDIYLIGNSQQKGMATRELIKLKHLKSTGIKETLPGYITQNSEIIEVKELNSIVVIGSRKIVDEAKAFVAEIDHTVPQILLEALVVDYRITDVSEFDLEMGVDSEQDAGAFQFYPFIQGTTTKSNLEASFSASGSPLISKNIGYLPNDFYMQLKALEQDGYAKIQSKPHIATLNGNKASLVISTTQYYIFDSEVIVPTTGQPTTQKTQRFEKISAEIRLEITPWVSAGGEITTEIHPEFSTPQGSFSPDVPPTINSRIFDSTVRLKDGETIVLGGLIQTDDSKSRGKFPVLGDIPLLGALFRTYSNTTETSELVIYITPRLNMEPVDPTTHSQTLLPDTAGTRLKSTSSTTGSRHD